MKNFIEVTGRLDGSKELININQIRYIDKTENICFMTTSTHKKRCFGCSVQESYEELIEKIKQAEGELQ